jgi:hypothetical protein
VHGVIKRQLKKENRIRNNEKGDMPFATGLLPPGPINVIIPVGYMWATGRCRSDIPLSLFFIDRVKPRSFNVEMGRPIDYVTSHNVVSS